jgi:hypothetical protein
MTAPRDPDRLINAFLMEGQTDLADPIYDAVRATIDHTHQRVVVGPWRLPIMNKFVPLGAGVAAVVVALLVGTRLLGPPAPGGVGGGPSVQPSVQPSATPSATPGATSAPSAATPSTAIVGRAPGPFVFNSGGGPAITVTIAAAGWDGDTGTLVKNGNADPPDGVGMIGPWYGPLYVYRDPCRWSTTTPKTPAATVGDMVAALTAQASRNASAPVDITVDGYSGKSITLHVPDDAVFDSCDGGKFGMWQTAAVAVDGPDRYNQGAGQIDEVLILDVSGKLMVFDAAYYQGTPAGDLAELHAMLDSMTFKK